MSSLSRSMAAQFPVSFALCALSFPVSAFAADFTLRGKQQAIVVHENDGSYEIIDGSLHHAMVHAQVDVQIDHKWLTCGDFPEHRIRQSSFDDAPGHGEQLAVECSGLTAKPDLSYTVGLFDNIPAGEIRVTVENRTNAHFTVQAIRSVDATGEPSLYTGKDENGDRILSDSFSEDWPPLKIYDYDQASGGVFRAVGSQLIYNRTSRVALFFGVLSSDRFLTILHWRVKPDGAAQSSYIVDSTGTTEIQATDPESGLKDGPARNLIELSQPLAPGATMNSELLMFSSGPDYHAILENYGEAIRKLHRSRYSSKPVMGWWSWTAYYSGITQANTTTNAEWLAQHLEPLDFDYFHLDLGYAYARGEYATPNAAQFPDGLSPLAHKVCSLGLRLGFWTAPFEVSDRSWVYENHKDWLVHNSDGEPIEIGVGDEAGREVLFVLDATNPAAQQYLRETYRTLTRDWGARYIKLDFMDNTAIEGDYFRPHTTALEAQRIGLQVIRDAVGNDVLLDKDGSPMLNPVGLVDEGRLSQDTGHTFLRSKEAAPGIAARYYMNRNFFMSDPDAFTVSKQMIEEREIMAPLTLPEAEASITLAALAGGMFEIGDDLPTLGSDPERLALVKNPDLLQMIRLGRAATPLDLMTYSAEDEQPSIFLLREDRRQSMLAVFNWSDHSRTHIVHLGDLSLPSADRYDFIDAFHPEAKPSFTRDELRLENQPPHSVRLLKIVDDSLAPQPPAMTIEIPVHGKLGEPLLFSASRSAESIPALSYHWEFGDGVVMQGEAVSHAFTHAGTYQVNLTAEGLDGISFAGKGEVSIGGRTPVAPPSRFVPHP
jgi:alpha-galactosidase